MEQGGSLTQQPENVKKTIISFFFFFLSWIKIYIYCERRDSYRYLSSPLSSCLALEPACTYHTEAKLGPPLSKLSLEHIIFCDEL